MIAFLKGTLLEKDADRVVIDAGGVGYEVLVGAGTAAALPGEGAPVELFISESVAMYGGGTTLYGFATREDKRMFLAFKELPATGAKKALDHLEKARRSLPDFRRAVLDGDARLLHGMFGFTRKTAERVIAGLAERLRAAPAKGAPRIAREDGAQAPAGPLSRAMDALSALGYKPLECRSALESVQREVSGRDASVEEIIRLALRRL